MIRGVLFDMNGVLLDSELLNIKIWKLLFQEYEINFNYEIYHNSIDGRTTMEIAKKSVSINKVEEFIKRKDSIRSSLLNDYKIPVFSDVIKCLDKLKKERIRTGVVTSSRHGVEILTKTGLIDYFDLIVTGKDIEKGKPAPDIILKALEELKISAPEVILVEDSASGIEAGMMAGVYCVGILRDGANKELKCRHCINNLNELDFERGIIDE